jgi:hypothetical protein
MFKLGHCVDGEWRAYSHPPIFSAVRTHSGQLKVLATAPGSDPLVFTTLSDRLTPPYFLLYILHTPRGEGEAGRYQSAEIDRAELHLFMREFANLLSTDGRFDLWLHSPSDGATIVWDRHDLIHAYGMIDAAAEALRGLGFAAGEPTIPAPHEHHFHAACDASARALLANRDWQYSVLREEDVQ